MRRSVSACALPRPSATASAKFAKSTVNHSHAAIAKSKPGIAAVAQDIAHEEDRRRRRADLDDEHDRIAGLPARIELLERIPKSARDESPDRRASALSDGAPSAV